MILPKYPAVGSNGKIYKINALFFNIFRCECKGYLYHGYCYHIRDLQQCPNCHTIGKSKCPLCSNPAPKKQ